MKLNVFPGYENHLLSQQVGESEQLTKRRQAQGQALMSYQLPADMKMEDKVIPGGDGQDLNIRIYTPAGLPQGAPMILDIHGGAFVGGNLDIDNARCIALASRVGAVVVGVEYRLSVGGVHFPAPLMDCRAAYLWMIENAAALGVRAAGTGGGADAVLLMAGRLSGVLIRQAAAAPCGGQFRLQRGSGA